MKTINIIGGGVLGLTTAFYLATSDLSSRVKIKVFDQSELGKESSWAGAGLLCPLMFWNYSDELCEFVLSSLKEYPKFINKLSEFSGIDPEFDQLGLTIFSPFDEEKALNWLNQFNYKYQYNKEHKKLYLPDVYLIRNPRFVQSLRQAMINLNVEIIENHKVSIQNLDNFSKQNNDEIFIFTTGAWTKQILPNLNIYPVKGQILLYKTDIQHLKSAIYKNGKYIVPRRDGHILVGSSLEQVGFNKETTQTAFDDLFNFGQEFIAEFKPKFVTQWAGLRPASDLELPYIHQINQNMLVNAGHFRYGVTEAPASALKILNLIKSMI